MGLKDAREVPGFSGYFVDRLGNVWSTRTRQGRHDGAPHLLKGHLNDGYPRVTLSNRDVRKRVFVHRLVAELFLGPCPEGMEVAHLNGDRADSRAENLRYVTRTENNHHKLLHGTMLRGDKHPRRAIDEATARAIGERLQHERSNQKVAAEFETSDGIVSQIGSGRNWRHVFPSNWKPPAKRRMTPAQRHEALTMVESGKTQRQVAEVFGVTQSAIGHLIARCRKELAHG